MNVCTEIHSLTLSDEHTSKMFQTKVLKISGHRWDEAVYDLVMKESLCNIITTFVILMKLITD